MPSSACDWSSDVCSSDRSEEHTSELQSRSDLVCRLLLEKKKTSVVSPPSSKIERRDQLSISSFLGTTTNLSIASSTIMSVAYCLQGPKPTCPCSYRTSLL